MHRYHQFFIAVSLALAPTLTISAQPPDPQQKIEEAIRKDFDDFAVLKSADLEVQLRSGIATIAGRVDNLLAKRRAADVAKRTRGVRAVDNQVIVEPSGKSDDELLKDVRAAIQAEPAIDSESVAVDVENGSVAVTGQTGSLAEKRLTETTVASVSGVREINNQLVVTLAVARDDAILKKEIAALLRHSVFLDDTDLSAEVQDGVARLQGEVATTRQKEIAEKTASVRGVRSVNMDRVSVNPERDDGLRREKRYAEVADEEASQALQLTWYSDPLVAAYADQLHVDVVDGVAILEGEVGRLRVKLAAELDAQNTVGVRSVENHITVNWPETQPSDEAIIRYAQEALERSAYVDRSDFRIHCRDAHLRLFGIVENPFQKKVAEYVLNGLPGVVHVANNLTVSGDWEPKPDKEIRSAIKRKWRYALPGVGEDLSVKVVDGVAILSGTVETWRQWQVAMDLAVEAGARDPHNMIDVELHPAHGGASVFVPED